MALLGKLQKCENAQYEGFGVRLAPIVCDADIEDALTLRVAPGQEDFVTPVDFSLAQAYVDPENNVPFLIRHGDEAVGFMMLRFPVWQDDPDVYTWRLLVDVRHQGKGYGRMACLIVLRLFQQLGVRRIELSVDGANAASVHLYVSLGFADTGEKDGDETVLARELVL